MDASLELRTRESQIPRRPGGNGRILFAIAWVGLQLALVATAGRRDDGAFGFRMFSESSTLRLTLWREIGPEGARQHVTGGRWTARGPDGAMHRLDWFERTPYWVFDQEIHASYGAQAQLGRLQLALDDVAAHIPNDAETRRLVLDVVVKRNGREPVLHTLTSRERGP